MASYEMYYKTLCRVCLQQSHDKTMVSLMKESSSNELSCYGIALCKFVNISLKKDDDLPAFMCQNCLYLLKQAIRLKLISEASDKRLKSLVQSINKNHSDSKQVMKTVIDHVLYGTLFNKTYSRKPNTTKQLPVTQKTADCSRVVKDNVALQSQDAITSHHLNNDDETFKYDSEDNKNINTRNKKNKDILKSKLKDLNPKKYLKRHALILRAKRKKESTEKNRNLVCELCKKVLATPLTLKHHMQRHYGARFICEYCAKHFPTHEELRIHLVCTHGTGQYFPCSKCSFKAPRKRELKEHDRLHTGERPYACDKCGLTFRTRYIWKKHSIYHEERTIQCMHCSRKFYLRSAMEAHINNVHERRYMYMCNQCGAIYARTGTVRRHLTQKHGIARELQGRIKRVLKGKDMEFPEQ